MPDKLQHALHIYLDRSMKGEPFVRVLPCVTVPEEAFFCFQPRTLAEAKVLLGSKWALSLDREPKITRKIQ